MLRRDFCSSLNWKTELLGKFRLEREGGTLAANKKETAERKVFVRVCAKIF